MPRSFITRLLAAAGALAGAALLMGGCNEASSTEPPPDGNPGGGSSRPNILIIIADDYGVDSALAYADTDGDGRADDARSYAPTPNISRLCRESGILFTRAWSAPICSPTRATMLTGRYGFRTGVGTVAGTTSVIRKDEVTLPSMFDAAASGYRHANIGKWHLGTTSELGGQRAPNTLGWSHYAGVTSGALRDYSSFTKTVNGTSVNVSRYATTDTVDDAIGWLQAGEAGKPWLLWLAFNAPHSPFHLPPRELHTYSQLSGDSADINSNSASYYQAAAQAMDTEIGRLLTWLKDNGQENTNILFLGDNGTPSAAVLPPFNAQRAKATLYEGGIHVPLCIAGPAVVAPGRRIDGLVNTVDLFATALDMAGVDRSAVLPKGVAFDSVSLMPYVENRAAGNLRQWGFSEVFGGTEVAGKAIRDERYKLIRNDDGTKQLFELTTDPLETKELLSAGPLTAEDSQHLTSLEAALNTLIAP